METMEQETQRECPALRRCSGETLFGWLPILSLEGRARWFLRLGARTRRPLTQLPDGSTGSGRKSGPSDAWWRMRRTRQNAGPTPNPAAGIEPAGSHGVASHTRATHSLHGCDVPEGATRPLACNCHPAFGSGHAPGMGEPDLSPPPIRTHLSACLSRQTRGTRDLSLIQRECPPPAARAHSKDKIRRRHAARGMSSCTQASHSSTPRSE